MGRKFSTQKTYQTILSDKLDSIEVGKNFSKENFIIENWGDYNYYICRSFDVFFTNVKKQLPEKEFRCIKRFIHRLK